MKQFYKLAVFLTAFFIAAGITACSADTADVSPEAEVAESLPLPSLEGEDNTSPSDEMQSELFFEEISSSYGPDSMVPSTNGLLTYYNQSDPRWGDELYGTSDYMKTHGCGPTAVAMVVSSFTATKVTPLDVAQWASDNGYCSRGEGSLHSLIPDGLSHYGLPVRPLEDRSEESVLREIRLGNVIVVLMNRGYFTEGGHFLLLTQVTEDGKLHIADPASWENSQKTWDIDFILGQARKKSDAGGPFWVVSLPEED